jgi:flagellin-specific chaperone FliS
MAQLAYNNKQSATTGLLPFFANHSKYANIFIESRQHMNTEKAIVTAEEIKELYKEIAKRINQQNKRTTKNINKRRKLGPQLKKGDKVYLLIKNLRSKRLSKKLDYIKVRLFLIKEVKGAINYKLNLPINTKIHPVFYISLLKPADPNIPV